MSIRKLSIIIIILTLGILGIYWIWHREHNTNAMGAGIPPSMVNVATAKLQPWQTQIPATGTLSALQGVLLKSEVAGRVTKIYFNSGCNVISGSPLVDIDPGVIQAQLAQAIAKAKLSSDDYQRAIELFQRGALSKQDMDTAQSNKMADAAGVKQMQAQLNQYQITAPFSGRTGLQLFNLGDYISVGQALVNLQQLDPLRVDFTVPENYLGQINSGDTVQIQSDTESNKTILGKVTAIDSAIDPATRTIALRANIPNANQKLLPGGFVQVVLLAGKSQMLVTIPQTALVYDASGNYVYTVVNQHAVKTPVTTGQQNSTQISVLSGLKPGDQVVVAGQLKIGDGSPVMAVPAG